jgi:hypothetical protein
MTDNNTKRIEIDCYHCRRRFSFLKPFDGQPTFILPCPFCHAALAVDLAPYVNPVRGTFAGDDAPFTLLTLNLPDVLPSRPSGDEAAP